MATDLDTCVCGACACFQRQRFRLTEIAFQKGEASGGLSHRHDLLARIRATCHEFCAQRVPFCIRPVSAFPAQITEQMKTESRMLRIALG